MLKMKTPWHEAPLDVRLRTDRYTNNGRLYVGVDAMDEDIGAMVPWCDISVNLPGASVSDAESCCFIDVNNAPYIEQFLVENGLAEPTLNLGLSGFCVYPEYRFNMEVLSRAMA